LVSGFLVSVTVFLVYVTIHLYTRVSVCRRARKKGWDREKDRGETLFVPRPAQSVASIGGKLKKELKA